ncbi:hypothetical protein GGU11DRAFT_823023 [Lentinula aff. detonsa]|nr:hypothetical protein GGU11DRAFT_823023 [Lentinula aff. detonsa]
MSSNPGRYNLRGQGQNDPAPPGDFDSAPSPEGNSESLSSPLTPIVSEGPSVIDPAPAGPEVLMPSGLSHESFGPGESEEPPPVQGAAMDPDASIGNDPESFEGRFLADVPRNAAPSKEAERDVEMREPLLRIFTPRNTSRVTRTGPVNNNDNSTLRPEQLRAIEQAEATLTEEQREQIRRRLQETRVIRDDEESQGEGPSEPKGKGVDPRNWGSSNLHDDEMNPDIQAQILQSIKDKKDRIEARHELDIMFQEWRATESERIEAKVRSESAKVQEQILERIAELQERFDSKRRDPLRGIKDEPRNVHIDDAVKEDIREVHPKRKVMSTFKPANLVAPESHVAKLFEQLRGTTPYNNSIGEEPDPEGGSSNNEEESQNHSRKRGMKIKPLKPTETYDGSPSLRSFQRHVREVIEYLEDGEVPEKKQVQIASRFLSKKAYSFYERVAGKNPGAFSLSDFYEKLYNHAFPLDFRTNQRRKLVQLQQKGRNVIDHIGFFQDLSNTAGLIDERSLVTILWDSFDPVIIKGLYRNGFTPETCTLSELMDEAELVEMVEGTGKNALPQANSTKNQSSSSKTYNGDGGRWKTKTEVNEHVHDNNVRTVNKPSNDTKPAPTHRRNTGNGNESSMKKALKNRLSDREKNEYRAAGKCFECGETTHRARDCPKKTIVRNTDKKSNGPPGLSTHNIEWEIVQHTDASVDLQEYCLGNVSWYDNVEAELFSGSDEEQLESDDDTLSNSADSNDGPLPDLISMCDSSSEGDLMDVDMDCKECGCSYISCECLPPRASDLSELEIDSPTETVTNLNNNNPKGTRAYYRLKCRADINEIEVVRNAIAADGSFALPKETKPAYLMGKINAPLAYRATELLTGNAPYLNEDGSHAEDIMHPDRFCVYQISDTEHLIMDTAYFDVEYRVQTNGLKNPDFRLIEWFCNERGETAAELEGLGYGC